LHSDYIPIHDRANSFKYNPYSEESGSVSDDTSLYIVVHGTLMSISWTFLSFSGIFIARYMKKYIEKYWFRTHIMIFATLFCLTYFAFMLAIVLKSGVLFNSVHGILGLLIIIGLPLQIVLGIIIDKMFDPSRSAIPLRDKVHWLFGIFLSSAGVVNVFIGHYNFGTPYVLVIINGLVLLFFIVIFIYGHLNIGQQHDMNHDNLVYTLIEDHET
jgi:Eukaryotic cytochrome b561